MSYVNIRKHGGTRGGFAKSSKSCFEKLINVLSEIYKFSKILGLAKKNRCQVFSEKFRQNLVFSILGKTIFYLKLIPSSAFRLSDWSFGSVFVALHELDVFRRFVVPVEFSGQLVVDILTELHCKSAKLGVSAQLK